LTLGHVEVRNQLIKRRIHTSLLPCPSLIRTSKDSFFLSLSVAPGSFIVRHGALPDLSFFVSKHSYTCPNPRKRGLNKVRAYPNSRHFWTFCPTSPRERNHRPHLPEAHFSGVFFVNALDGSCRCVFVRLANTTEEIEFVPLFYERPHRSDQITVFPNQSAPPFSRAIE